MLVSVIIWIRRQAYVKIKRKYFLDTGGERNARNRNNGFHLSGKKGITKQREIQLSEKESMGDTNSHGWWLIEAP